MELSLSDVSMIVGLVIFCAGLIGTWVETRLRVKELMRGSEVAITLAKETKVAHDKKAEELLAALNALRQGFAESVGEIRTVMAATTQKLDDLIGWMKHNGTTGGKNA
jgi:ribosomal protein L17